VDQHPSTSRVRVGQWLLVAGTVGVSLLNGIDISPAFDSVSFYLASFARGSPLFDAEVFYYLTSLSISLLTLIIAGIPAALYERMRGLDRSSLGSLAIWLMVAALLTLPLILRMWALGDE
jgi:hypothetical protein